MSPHPSDDGPADAAAIPTNDSPFLGRLDSGLATCEDCGRLYNVSVSQQCPECAVTHPQ
ncbi:hypothetical protein [Halonotius terrestris]|uniref:hypothetical protein n=1 Tax=Halonotius terrestris TaxID=2487750 RepID=UPI00163D3674|nr:hypothetical protein [Halonotius terrestris]